MEIEAGVTEPLEVLHGPSDPSALRLCLVVPQSGPLGMIGPSALDAALLAAHEVNAAGGVRDRRLELVLVDGGQPPRDVAAEVATLVTAGAVEAVAGFHASDVHRAVEPVVAGRVPYVFTPPQEGGPRLPGVVCTGVPPGVQLATAIDLLTERHRLRRWALVGNDYIWPRAVHRAARRAVARTPGDVVLEHWVPLGGVSSVLDRLTGELRARRADAVLLSLIGRDLVGVNRGLRRSGLDRRLVRLSGSLEENGLLAFGGDTTGGLYACMDAFASLPDDRVLRLTEAHQALLGPRAPVLDSYARGLYDGLHLVTALAELRSLAAPGLSGAVRRLLHGDDPEARSAWRHAPLGPPRNRIHLARAEGLDLRVVPPGRNPHRQDTSIWK